MAINLSRNTKVYFTTNVNANTGVLTDAAAGFTTSNLFEIAVLDGYSFSQGTQQATVTISEGGNTPTRGQRSFNSALDPVDWSISTYVRPAIVSTYVAPAEKYLWNALLGAAPLDDTGITVTTAPVRTVTTGASASTATIVLTGTATGLAVGDVINISGSSATGWNQPAVINTLVASTNTTCTIELAKAPATAGGLTATGVTTVFKGQWGKGLAASSYSYTHSMGSNKNQLQKFAMIFVVDNTIYCVDNCALDQASIDFGLDAIATIAWSGKGTALKKLSTITATYLTTNALAVNSSANYITNKLSTMTLESNIGGAQNTATASTSYVVPITGGNITISNNITYLVPSNLGAVNQPIGYFTGNRSVTGNVTAYLRTGANESGQLLTDMLTSAATSPETKFRLQLEMGGVTNANRVEFEMAGSMLQIPAVNIADVVSTDIKFTAQGYTPDVNGASTPSYDLTKTNDVVVRYFSA